MAINHLNAPTGNIADNVVGFARALRAAGIPVGSGAVIDAMNALQLIEIGNRADVYATLESIFVTRHEHAARKLEGQNCGCLGRLPRLLLRCRLWCRGGKPRG